MNQGIFPMQNNNNKNNKFVILFWAHSLETLTSRRAKPERCQWTPLLKLPRLVNLFAINKTKLAMNDRATYYLQM